MSFLLHPHDSSIFLEVCWKIDNESEETTNATFPTTETLNIIETPEDGERDQGFSPLLNDKNKNPCRRRKQTLV